MALILGKMAGGKMLFPTIRDHTVSNHFCKSKPFTGLNLAALLPFLSPLAESEQLLVRDPCQQENTSSRYPANDPMHQYLKQSQQADVLS